MRTRMEMKTAAKTRNDGRHRSWSSEGSVSCDTDVVCIDIEQGSSHQSWTVEASWIVAARSP